MALGQRNVKRRIFEKAGSGKDRMEDDKIAKLSASFAANIHIDHPELPDATEGILYAIQGVEEDVEELHRYLSNEVTTNTATNLSVSRNGSSFTINSSDGTNASLAAADTNNWGIMTDNMVDDLSAAKTATTTQVPYILNSGFHSRTTSRVYLPLTTAASSAVTSDAGYLEYGAWCAPCAGVVESVIIRSEHTCGNSTVGIHIAKDGVEMPGFNPGTFVSPAVYMRFDDVAYKFNAFRNQAGDYNSFKAGQVVVISFDPTNTPEDCVATIVFKLDWTKSL